MSSFQAIWPILDQRLTYDQLIDEAAHDLPTLVAQAHARITDWRAGRWSIARSVDVPGSGRITPTVLLYEAPAVAAVPAWRMGRAS